MRPTPRTTSAAFIACATAAATTPALAQWEPENGDWTKSHPTDLRIMTWNIEDGICSTAVKSDAFNAWNALVRITCALEPDIIIMQEAGDNDGNGTGSGVDSPQDLATTVSLFIHGGPDPFLGGAATSHLTKFNPALTYPHTFISANTDGFNRNIILSRFPFADLNSDLNDQPLYSDIIVFADKYAPGITGGIRGYMFAEIDLPDDTYTGDIVVGNGHLKASGGCANEQDREKAAKNIAYWIDHFYNGAGTSNPDPSNKIPFDDDDTIILPADTPVIWGGDMNQKLGGAGCFSKSPVEWLTQAALFSGIDGTDRDGSDALWDTAAHPLSGDASTQSSSKIDFLMWQDSIAEARRQFIFRDSGIAQAGAPYPSPVSTFPPTPSIISSTASDHRPVIIDFIVPLATIDPPPVCEGDITGDGAVGSPDLNALLAVFGVNGLGDLDDDGDTDSADLNILLANFGTSCLL